MSAPRTVEIAKDIYWVGGSSQEGGLNCNPYLLVDGDEAVLIDPGSVLDFEDVYENVRSIVPLEKIKYVILHHQDPDFCASVPLFEKAGGKFLIVTHWRTQLLVKFYGITSDYYIINENEYQLNLKSGRTLGFVMTPYLHFPGAFTTYDYESKVLFSSDLFGAYSFVWNLYAKDDYIEKMKTFHEHYMPSNSILRPVMEVFLGMDIDMIAPQHGSIINENTSVYIKALRDLECGKFLNPIKQDLAKSGGYMTMCTMVLKRYASIFDFEEVVDAIGDLEITLDEKLNITDYNYTGDELWNLIFEKVLIRKGLQWLMIIEPLVEMISLEYEISMPQVFKSNIKRVEQASATLNEQNQLLKESIERLEASLKESEHRLTRDPVTGLFNFEFFKNYLNSEINGIIQDRSIQNPALIVVSLDNLEKIENYYGTDEVDEVLKNALYILEGLKGKNDMLFRLQGFAFICYIPQSRKDDTLELAEKIRNAIAASEKFIEKITASIGVTWFDDIRDNDEFSVNPDEALYNIALRRVRIARSKGQNMVCGHSALDDYREEIGKILLVDSDQTIIDVLTTSLENINYQVISAGDGEEALKIVKESHLLLIISGIMLPKMDGFLFREKLLSDSNTKNIPFIYLSYLKNDASVLRASSLGVEHYFKKPFMLSEIIGVIQNKVKGNRHDD
ncbi:diguanylate cyclase domain-containing protein [Acetobacterium fimetarium]|nr:diguanylate cyclase [Acetobacterium fimetarium]